MIVSFLAAVDRNLVLGDEKGIPWHLPADLKRFRKLTLGKPIVMGRTTFEHIGRPLDKRPNVVLSRRTAFRPEGVQVARSMDEALKVAGNVLEVVVIGGGEVFRAALSWVNRLYLTFVDGDFRGTAYFPAEIPTPAGFEWRVTHRESIPADERNPHPHRFLILDRIDSGPAPGGSLSIRELYSRG